MNNARTRKAVVAWVEDDRDYRDLVRQWLETRYEVLAYGSGEQLLADLDRIEPDAIMLDVGLPGMDGFALCRRLRAERLVAVPVLFLTSSAEQDDYLKSLDLGATGYLTKPVGRHQLLARLSELIDGERGSHPEQWKEAPGWMSTEDSRHRGRGSITS